MAEATRELLEKFASDTRHRDHELEAGTEPLARKLLATQAPIVDNYARVYPFVAGDADRINVSCFKWEQFTLF